MNKEFVKNSILNLVKLSLAIALIYWLIERDYFNWEDLKIILNPFTITLSTVLVFLSFIFLSIRWKTLLDVQSVVTPFPRVLKFTLIGVFFNHLITGQLSGDVAKVYYLIREHPNKKLQIISTTVVDRIVGIYVMIALGVLGIVLDYPEIKNNSQLVLISKSLIMIFVAASLFFYLIFSNKVHSIKWVENLFLKNSKLNELSNTLKRFFENKKVFYKVVSLTAAAQLCAICTLYFFGVELGYSHISISAYFFLCSVGFIVSALPISPAGIGVGQAAFFMLFNLYLGQKSSLGPALITGIQFVTILFAIIGSVLYLTNKRNRSVLE